MDHPDFSRSLGASLGVGVTRALHRRVRLDLAVAGTYRAAAIQDWAVESFGLDSNGDWEVELLQIDISPRIIIDLDNPADLHFYLIGGPEFRQTLSAVFLDQADEATGNESLSAGAVGNSAVAISYGVGLSAPGLNSAVRLEVRRSRTLKDVFSDRRGRMDGVVLEISLGH